MVEGGEGKYQLYEGMGCASQMNTRGPAKGARWK